MGHCLLLATEDRTINKGNSMKYLICVLLASFATTACSQPSSTEASETACAKRVFAYVDGLQTAYDLTKTPEAKRTLESTQFIQKNMTACAAEEHIPALAKTKAAIKAADEAVSPKASK